MYLGNTVGEADGYAKGRRVGRVLPLLRPSAPPTFRLVHQPARPACNGPGTEIGTGTVAAHAAASAGPLTTTHPAAARTPACPGTPVRLGAGGGGAATHGNDGDRPPRSQFVRVCRHRRGLGHCRSRRWSRGHHVDRMRVDR